MYVDPSYALFAWDRRLDTRLSPLTKPLRLPSVVGKSIEVRRRRTTTRKLSLTSIIPTGPPITLLPANPAISGRSHHRPIRSSFRLFAEGKGGGVSALTSVGRRGRGPLLYLWFTAIHLDHCPCCHRTHHFKRNSSPPSFRLTRHDTETTDVVTSGETTILSPTQTLHHSFGHPRVADVQLVLPKTHHRIRQPRHPSLHDRKQSFRKRQSPHPSLFIACRLDRDSPWPSPCVSS